VQGAPFYDFWMEARVSPDRMLRSFDQIVDPTGIQLHLAPFYRFTGQSSVAPGQMIRMLLVGNIMSIRSERRLRDEVHLNLAYR